MATMRQEMKLKLAVSISISLFFALFALSFMRENASDDSLTGLLSTPHSETSSIYEDDVNASPNYDVVRASSSNYDVVLENHLQMLERLDHVDQDDEEADLVALKAQMRAVEAKEDSFTKSARKAIDSQKKVKQLEKLGNNAKKHAKGAAKDDKNADSKAGGSCFAKCEAFYHEHSRTLAACRTGCLLTGMELVNLLEEEQENPSFPSNGPENPGVSQDNLPNPAEHMLEPKKNPPNGTPPKDTPVDPAAQTAWRTTPSNHFPDYKPAPRAKKALTLAALKKKKATAERSAVKNTMEQATLSLKAPQRAPRDGRPFVPGAPRLAPAEPLSESSDAVVEIED